jgi:hypothetical protein
MDVPFDGASDLLITVKAAGIGRNRATAIRGMGNGAVRGARERTTAVLPEGRTAVVDS